MIDYGAEIERITGGPPGKVAFRALCALIGRAGSPPELVALCEERLAFLTHLDMEDSDDPDSDDADDPGTGEPDDSEWEARGADHDFRAGRAERHLKYLDEAATSPAA